MPRQRFIRRVRAGVRGCQAIGLRPRRLVHYGRDASGGHALVFVQIYGKTCFIPGFISQQLCICCQYQGTASKSQARWPRSEDLPIQGKHMVLLQHTNTKQHPSPAYVTGNHTILH